MASKEEDFVVASHALWAGDVASAEKILGAISPRKNYRRDVTELDGAKGVISHVAGLRQWQISYRRGRLSKLAKAHRLDREEPAPVIAAAGALRGVVTTLSAREFLLRAYVSTADESVPDRVYRNAERLKIAAKTREKALVTERSMTRTYGWVEPGDVFLHVIVSSLCQIEARALWTGPTALVAIAPIVQRFTDLLQRLNAGGKGRHL